MIVALILSALAGYIALSYEILWYRALSFASGGSAMTFPLMLGWYLLGLALGSLGVRRWCGEADETSRRRALGGLGLFVLAANVLGFLLVPLVAWLVSRGWSWKSTLPFVGVVAACLGAVFPLLSHYAVAPDARAGSRVSYIYMANIVGSAAGSLLTGFLLLDCWSLPRIGVFLGLFGIAMSAVLLVLGKRAPAILACAACGAAVALAGPRLFDGLYERLQRTPRFIEVVETKSGVVTVTPDGKVYGGGIYDGAFNTDLDHDVNWIIRPFALGGLRPHPRDVLMIGLASGSWATIVADHPEVRRLTIVEINPGYVQVIERHTPALLSHPKVTIVFDDGRRWLVRNADRKFDLIVANTTFHWRGHATGLLSTEFLSLVRRHLTDGGLYFFNATGSNRAHRTAAEHFPYALRVLNCIAVSDSPIEFDESAWRALMKAWRIRGAPVLTGDVERRLDELVARLRAEMEDRASILARTAGLKAITDDNMGTEWTEGRE